MKFIDFPFVQGADGIKILQMNDSILPKYLFNLLRTSPIKPEGYKRHYGKLREQKIPLPPIEVQCEIVAEIEGYQNVIDGARQVVESWKPKFDINSTWSMVKLKDVCEVNPESCNPVDLFGDESFVYVDISSIDTKTGVINFENNIMPSNAPSRARRIVKEKDIILSTVRPNLKAFAFLKQLPEKVLVSTGFAVLRARAGVDPNFLFISVFMDDIINQMVNAMGKGAYPSINTSDVENLIIPLPPISVQREIVAKIEAERKIVDGCRELIALYEAKIKRAIDKVWEE